jgi:hypothetical protein
MGKAGAIGPLRRDVATSKLIRPPGFWKESEMSSEECDFSSDAIAEESQGA